MLVSKKRVTVLPTIGEVKIRRSSVGARNPIIRGSAGLVPREDFEI